MRDITASPPARKSSNPNGRPVHGQTVGMAVKEAARLAAGIGIRPGAREFCRSVHEVASDLIRVSAMLEAGNLAPSARERVGAREEAEGTARGRRH